MGPVKGPKRQIFKKLKNIPRYLFIQSISVLGFNMIRRFFYFPRLPEVLKKNGSQGPKKGNFQKMKKNTRYSSNLQLC